MKDSTLLKLALSFSLIGLIALLVMTEFVKPNVVSIRELPEKLDEFVAVEGAITKATYKEDLAFFDIEDQTGKVPVVIFDKLTTELKVGDIVQIAGKVSLYKGEFEIVADEIVCLKCESYS